MEILRFLTAGSVDDGKSTLIGRILYETGALKIDQIQSVSKLSNDNSIDYSLFTDGLGFERENKITLDVSYQYFSTEKRRFIIADCPGHPEYTRNMISGASTASALVLMVNAEKGIQPQTKLHLQIAAMLHIRHVVVCINKMDLVNYDQAVFEEIKRNISGLNIIDSTIHFIPTSATNGDFILKPSPNMQWYEGAPLMKLLETLPISSSVDESPCFAIQLKHHSKNGHYFLGRVITGEVKVGQELMVSPHKAIVTIQHLYQGDKPVPILRKGDYGSLKLTNDSPINTSSVLTSPTHEGGMKTTCRASLCWMDDHPLTQKKFIFKTAIQSAKCQIEVEHKLPIKINDLFIAHLNFDSPIFLAPYSIYKEPGAFILIDPETNMTVAAGTLHK